MITTTFDEQRDRTVFDERTKEAYSANMMACLLAGCTAVNREDRPELFEKAMAEPEVCDALDKLMVALHNAWFNDTDLLDPVYVEGYEAHPAEQTARQRYE